MKDSEIIEAKIRALNLVPTGEVVTIRSRRFSKTRQSISDAPVTSIRLGFGAYAVWVSSPDTFATLARNRYWFIKRCGHGFIEELWAEPSPPQTTAPHFECYDTSTNKQCHPDPQPPDENHQTTEPLETS